MQNLRNYQNPVKHLYDAAFFKWNLTYSEPWHILKLWYIQNPVKYIRWIILFRNLRYSIFRLPIKYSLRRTMCNFGIFAILAYSSPGRLRAQGILRNLSKMYDGLFSTEPCVTLVFSKLEAYSESCQIFMMGNFIHNLVWPQHI